MKASAPLKILVVDDEVIIADNLCLILKKLGYEPVEPALSYSEAIEKIEESSFDLAMLDINLKTKKTGVDLAKTIREKLDIPIIFLTAYSDNITLGQAKLVNPDGYIVKPYEAASVFATIEIAINNHSGKSHQQSFNDNAQIHLTESEMKILGLIGENLSTKEIADKLYVSQSTVKNHRHNICSKLNLKGGTHSLLKWVMENQIQQKIA
ncbi:MAG: response regulator transcription factor [Cyclobacteriaceae bacterium]